MSLESACCPESCPLCGAHEIAPRYLGLYLLNAQAESTSRDVCECGVCGLMMSSLPKGVGDASYYIEKPAEDHELLSQGRDRFVRVRRALESALGRRPRELLDVGAAGGEHLTVYDEETELFAVEPSHSGRSLMERHGIDVLGSDIAEVARAQGFDAVTCLDVLEHVPESASFLDSLASLVVPGGVLVVVTGDTRSLPARLSGRRWGYMAMPEHCRFFSEDALCSYLAARHGFELVSKSAIANQDVDLRYILRFLKAVAKEIVLKLMGDRVAREYERQGRAMFPFFYDNMLLVFRATVTGEESVAAISPAGYSDGGLPR